MQINSQHSISASSAADSFFEPVIGSETESECEQMSKKDEINFLESQSNKQIQCSINSSVRLMKEPMQGPYCNSIWDEIYCWPPTLANTTISRPCTEVMKDDEEVDSANIVGFAYRVCSENGTWLWGNWTNYTECISGLPDTDFHAGKSEELFTVKTAVCYILFIGSIVSLFSLLTALFIFYFFKSTRCPRITIHIHLMLALALRYVLLIVISEPCIFRRTNNYRTVDWICKVVLGLQFYAMIASINWMFVQGHHLHTKITNAFHRKFPFQTYCVIGWGLPLIMIGIWSAVMETYHPVPCWKNYGNLPYNWIILGPMMIMLLFNFTFLINILKFLITKIQYARTASERALFRRAVKGSSVLFVLLGINNLLFVYNPGGAAEIYYMIVNSSIQSIQGLFVSVFYCFLSRDVKEAIYRRFGWRLLPHRTNAAKTGKKKTPHGCISKKRKIFKNVEQNLLAQKNIDGDSIHPSADRVISIIIPIKDMMTSLSCPMYKIPNPRFFLASKSVPW